MKILKAEVAEVLPNKLSIAWLYYDLKHPVARTFELFDEAVRWLEKEHYVLADYYVDTLDFQRFVFRKSVKPRRALKEVTPASLRERLGITNDLPF